MIMNEFLKMYDISRRILKQITTRRPQQEKPLLSPRTEQIISATEEKPLLPEEVPLLEYKTEVPLFEHKTEEELPKPSQRKFLPLKKLSEKIKTLKEGQQLVPSAPLKEKPLLLEPEEIQEGQLILQTGSGIPVGGGTQRRRRISKISRKRVLNRLIKRGEQAISKISRLVKKIGRKSKRKRTIGRRKQIRRRTTTRRRRTTTRRRTRR
jgi:hypothetical protein